MKGLFNCARTAIAETAERRCGRIILITAASGSNPPPQMAHIAAAKTGGHGFARSITAEFAAAGMTVNVIAPGLVNTPILRNFSEEALMEFSRQVPIGRIGRPEEIAEAALYFASDEAAYVTGQILNMRGGTVI